MRWFRGKGEAGGDVRDRVLRRRRVPCGLLPILNYDPFAETQSSDSQLMFVVWNSTIQSTIQNLFQM